MKAKSRCVPILIVLLMATTVHGEITVNEKETAQEQLEVARNLVLHALSLQPSEDRNKAILNAYANFEIVVRRWPDDRWAVITARLGQADLFLNTNRAPDAAEALHSLVPLVEGTGDEPQVLAKLGAASFRSGTSAAEAERWYHKAIAAADRLENPSLQRLTAMALAQFYSESAQPEKAATHFRGIAERGDLSAAERAGFALHALREQMHAGNDVMIQKDIARVRALLAQSRRDVAESDKRSLADSVEAALENLLHRRGKPDRRP